MAYTSKLNPQGNYEIFQNNQRIATGSEAILSQYGLSAENPSNLPIVNPNKNYFDQPITTDLFKPVTAIKPIPPKTDNTNYSSLIDHGQGIIGANNPPANAVLPAAESDLTTRLNDLITSLGTAPASNEAAYNTAYENSGIQTQKETALAKQSKVKSAQAELAGIQAQIQGVINKRDAENLRIEQTINQGSTGIGGAGALANTSFLNVRKNEINRQAAIEALPLQALALAKQAEVAGLQGEAEYAQSTLKLAQDRLDTAFQLKSKDIENSYNFAKENRKAIYDFLTTEQKRRADAKQKQEDQEFTTQQNNLNYAQTLSSKAIENGQPDIAVKLNQLDPKSKTYQQDIASLAGQINIKPKEDVTATAGSIEEFKLVYGRAPKDLAELNAFTASREAARIDETKPLSILDIARYTELYPEAGVEAGDTESTANAKVAKINTPEAKIRNLVIGAKENNKSFQEVVKVIDEDNTIKDKELAKKIATEVYGNEAIIPEPFKAEPLGSRGQLTPQESFINSISNSLFRRIF